MLKAKLLGATAAAEPVFIEDVFSTYLYTGNGSGQVIQNGINLGQSFGSGSAEFDGSGDYLLTPSNTSLALGAGDFTLEFFVFSRVQNGHIVDTRATTQNGIGINFGITTNKFSVISEGAIKITSAGTFSLNTWYHVATVRNGSTITLYVDGVSQGSYTSTTNLSDDQITIGAYGLDRNTYQVNGYISNVRVVKGTALYTSNFTPPTSELTAIAGTSLLTCQGADPFVDNSPNAFTITKNGNPQARSFGPFDAATPGEGGLTWIKQRTSLQSHYLFDTERGAGFGLRTNSTAAEFNYTMYNYNFNSDGFSFATSDGALNGVGDTYVSWTFRKAPRFFDVVTYTGNGTTQAINHNLGSVPGVIITKRTDSADDWTVYHRSEGATRYAFLHLTNAFATSATRWNNTEPTDTQFFLGNDGATNGSGGSFVAYLFAHDPLGPSGDGSDGLIACGSYTGNGSSAGPEINLGWEPQWVMVKRASGGTGGWFIFDNMRGIVTGGADATLQAESSNAENTADNRIHLTATGFKVETTSSFFNNSPDTYIYIAIRRGPMREPESGTEVFAPVATTATSNTTTGYDVTAGFPVDLSIFQFRNASFGSSVADRLRGISNTAGSTATLYTYSTSAESPSSDQFSADNMTGIKNYGYGTQYNLVNWLFRRAPGFFDVVAYTGDGVAGRTVPHNLGVAPEFLVTKSRTNTSQWRVYAEALGPTKYLELQSTASAATSSLPWNNTAPTATEFTLGATTSGNASGQNYIAYLFASKAGVSKVGSYTGNGSSQTIDCGFTAGARFVLIKRTDSTGDWYVWDTARGIVAGNDPHLSLNTTAAEVTTNDSIDPDSSGFIVNQLAATNINVSSASYIYLAIA